MLPAAVVALGARDERAGVRARRPARSARSSRSPRRARAAARSARAAPRCRTRAAAACTPTCARRRSRRRRRRRARAPRARGCTRGSRRRRRRTPPGRRRPAARARRACRAARAETRARGPTRPRAARSRPRANSRASAWISRCSAVSSKSTRGRLTADEGSLAILVVPARPRRRCGAHSGVAPPEQRRPRLERRARPRRQRGRSRPRSRTAPRSSRPASSPCTTRRGRLRWNTRPARAAADIIGVARQRKTRCSSVFQLTSGRATSATRRARRRRAVFRVAAREDRRSGTRRAPPADAPSAPRDGLRRAYFGSGSSL